MVAAVEEVLDEIGADELPRAARAEQDRPRRRGRPPPAREPLPRRAAGLGRDRRGARGAEGAARGAVRGPLGARAPAASRTTRARALSELYALGAPIERARTRPRACSCVARLPRRDLPPLRAASCRRGRAAGDAPDRAADPAAARRTRSCPARAYAGDAGLDLVGVRARRARAGRARARRRPGSRSRSRRATRASCSRARGSRAKHGISIVNTPGPRRLRLPRRAARRAAQHRPARDVRGRAGDADRPARGRCRCPRSSRSRSTSCPSRSGASAASGRRRH